MKTDNVPTKIVGQRLKILLFCSVYLYSTS